MDLTAFHRALAAFADRPADVDIDRGKLLVQIRDELIEGSLEFKEGSVWVTEGGQTLSAFRWFVERVARVHLLADRIREFIPREANFVTPSGKLLDQLDSGNAADELVVTDAAEAVNEILARRPAGMSTVLYLTSDAGEGKTTLINEVALNQAERYRRRETDWLIVPITLGGKPFMRLDDIVVADLSNRLRYMLYFDAFLELVRLNVIVPALDGFEEVFLEGAPGEAVSALGNLINDLEGEGRLLIAARKAYFEINSFAAQARLHDSISDAGGVDFARIALQRWSQEDFEEYATKRGVAQPNALYRRVTTRLGESHPLVTRAVLVEKLVNVTLEGDVDGVLEQLGQEPEDYFFRFVNAIVERESRKWIGPAVDGGAAQPILTVSEHHALLAAIAREMWVANAESLRSDYLDIIAELVGADLNKGPRIVRQIKNRLAQHSLLVSVGAGKQISFDHEDFRRFYLGEALALEMGASEASVIGFLRVGVIPAQTVDAAIAKLRRDRADLEAVRRKLQLIGSAAPATSYVKENIGALTVRLLEVPVDQTRIVQSLVFPNESLRGRVITNVTFEQCHFHPSSTSGSRFTHVEIRESRIERLELDASLEADHVQFVDVELGSLHDVQREESVFDPARMAAVLSRYNVSFNVTADAEQLELTHKIEPDRETLLAEHALRVFMRSTHVNENVLRQKMGTRANEFFDDVLPEMIERGIIEKVQYKGSGRQERYKLLVPMRNIDDAIRLGRTFDDFVRVLTRDAERAVN